MPVSFGLRLTLLVAVTVALVQAMAPYASAPGVRAQDAVYALALDADTSNGGGPCDPIDDTASIAPGSEFAVAICVVDPPEPVSAFFVELEYDGALMVAPEAPPTVGRVDENPDGNLGETTFPPTYLGDGWVCTGLSLFPPAGDVPETVGIFDARIACTAPLQPDADLRLTETGTLAVARFRSQGAGAGRIEFTASSEMGMNPGVTRVGRCADVVSGKGDLIACRSAVIYAGVGDETVVPTRTVPAPTAAARASQTALADVRQTAVAQVTPQGSESPAPDSADDDGAGINDVLALIFVVAVIAAVVLAAGVGLFAVTRRSG